MLPSDVDAQLRRFLAEDLGGGDVTSEAIVPPRSRAEAALVARAEGILAGADLVERIVRMLDPGARVTEALADGTRVTPGRVAATLRGEARALLAAERTLLNLVQRMSGIATLTAKFVAAVAGTGAAILDTRKTAPGLRGFDKRAVAAGGGVNHRMGLGDQLLVKSNHLHWIAAGAGPSGARPLEAAIGRARAGSPGMRLEVEVFDAAEALRAAAAGADLVLLDNLTPAQVADAVRQVRARFSKEQVGLEVSGNVTLGNVRAFAEGGVERISIGALTHSAPALDLALVFARPAPGATGVA